MKPTSNMLEIKRAIIPVVLLGIGTVTVLAVAATYAERNDIPCKDDNGCTSFTLPAPVRCEDTGSYTGQVPGESTTNKVVLTYYAGGFCIGAPSGSCSPGTFIGNAPQTQVNHYCKPGGG